MRARRTIRFIAWTLLFLSLATVVWSGVYVYRRGFTRKWREFVVEEFRKRGFEVSFSRLTLDPFKGLVARNVRLMDAVNGEGVLATIDEIVLDLNYGNLIHGEPFLNAVDLRDANLALPIDPADRKSERLEINRLNARLLLPAHQAYLSQAEADVYGIRVSASGRLINLAAYKPSPEGGKADSEPRTALVLKIIDELKALEFRSGPPSLEIRFAGDLAAPDRLFVEASLKGRNIVHRGFVIEDFALSATYRDRVLNLAGLELRDPEGTLQISGGYDDRTKAAAIRLRSSVDLAGLLQAVDVKLPLEGVVFHEAPQFELNGKGTLGETPEFLVVGHLDAESFGVKGVEFESLLADFSWAGSQWSVRDFRLTHRTGEVTCDAMRLPGSFRAKLASTIDPTVLLPFVEGNAAKFLSEWEFARSPEIRLSAQGPSPDFGELEMQGELTLGRTTFRGQSLKSGTSKFRVRDKAATYENFRVERDEGVATGTFIYDFGRKEVVLKDVRAGVTPAEAIVWIDPKLVKPIEPYRFHVPPSVAVNGVVHYQRGNTTRLRIDVNAPRGMDYTFMGKELDFPSISGNLLVTPGRLEIHDLKGTLYGGPVTGEADISLRREKPGYSAELEAEGVDFAALTKLYFDYDDSKGRLHGQFAWTGKSDDPRTIEGTGSLRVVEGNVFAIPTLGPLSAILNEIVPNMGYSIARDAVASFTMRDGVIHTDDFAVHAAAFEMLGKGDLFFLDDDIRFDIRINARGIPGVLLFPVSKLFEYTADGTLRKPGWRPKVLPKF